MSNFKKRLSPAEFAESETQINCLAGLLGGSIGALVTNSLDSLTVQKQTHPALSLPEILRKEGLGLFSKGLLANVYYCGAQSIFFFFVVMKIGKIYRVELNED